MCNLSLSDISDTCIHTITKIMDKCSWRSFCAYQSSPFGIRTIVFRELPINDNTKHAPSVPSSASSLFLTLICYYLLNIIVSMRLLLTDPSMCEQLHCSMCPTTQYKGYSPGADPGFLERGAPPISNGESGVCVCVCVWSGEGGRGGG